MRNLSVVVGAALLCASAGAEAAVWDAGFGWKSIAAGHVPQIDTAAAPDSGAWPFQVNTMILPFAGDGEGLPPAWSWTSAVLQFDYSFEASWTLTQPDGNVWEHELAWNGTSMLPLPDTGGLGWLIATQVSMGLAPEPGPGGPAPVPLPATAVLFPIGLGLLGMIRRARNRRAAG